MKKRGLIGALIWIIILFIIISAFIFFYIIKDKIIIGEENLLENPEKENIKNSDVEDLIGVEDLRGNNSDLVDTELELSNK